MKKENSSASEFKFELELPEELKTQFDSFTKDLSQLSFNLEIKQEETPLDKVF